VVLNNVTCQAGANAREGRGRPGLWRARGRERCAVFGSGRNMRNLDGLQGQRTGVKEGSDQIQHHGSTRAAVVQNRN
jgi:hypothetical protein